MPMSSRSSSANVRTSATGSAQAVPLTLAGSAVKRPSETVERHQRSTPRRIATCASEEVIVAEGGCSSVVVVSFFVRRPAPRAKRSHVCRGWRACGSWLARAERSKRSVSERLGAPPASPPGAARRRPRYASPGQPPTPGLEGLSVAVGRTRSSIRRLPRAMAPDVTTTTSSPAACGARRPRRRAPRARPCAARRPRPRRCSSRA